MTGIETIPVACSFLGFFLKFAHHALRACGVSVL